MTSIIPTVSRLCWCRTRMPATLFGSMSGLHGTHDGSRAALTFAFWSRATPWRLGTGWGGKIGIWIRASRSMSPPVLRRPLRTGTSVQRSDSSSSKPRSRSVRRRMALPTQRWTTLTLHMNGSAAPETAALGRGAGIGSPALTGLGSLLLGGPLSRGSAVGNYSYYSYYSSCCDDYY